MRRRDFLFGVGCAASVAPSALGQTAPKLTIGFLHSASPDGYEAQLRAFHDGLRLQGFVEGQNLAVLYRWARDAVKDLPALAKDLVAQNVAAIVAAGGDLSAQAAKGATEKIPIIFTIGGDPVRARLVESINRPGGNVTGVTLFTIDLGAKRLELFRELLPKARTIALLAHPNYSLVGNGIAEIERGASMLSLETRVLKATNAAQIDEAFSELSRSRPDGLLIVSNPLFSARRKQIIANAERNSLPAIYPLIDFTHDGGLMSYGSNSRTGYRETGITTGRILKGEKPGEYPVMQPTRFELAFNLKTAKALGIEVPPMLLARADEVIE